MWQKNQLEMNEEELFLAGEKVRPGIYRQLESAREIRLDKEDILPASLDGRVACYMRIRSTWAEQKSTVAA
jgi:hypothetical protein